MTSPLLLGKRKDLSHPVQEYLQYKCLTEEYFASDQGCQVALEFLQWTLCGRVVDPEQLARAQEVNKFAGFRDRKARSNKKAWRVVRCSDAQCCGALDCGTCIGLASGLKSLFACLYLARAIHGRWLSKGLPSQSWWVACMDNTMH
jgi:hypothetical protein